jgi:hypothetical protein
MTIENQFTQQALTPEQESINNTENAINAIVLNIDESTKGLSKRELRGFKKSTAYLSIAEITSIDVV